MFNDILSTSTSRLSEVREMLNYITENTPAVPASPSSTVIALKGMFFVYLYGVYECTVKSTVLRTIEKINEANVNIGMCKEVLSCLILNDCYNSLASVGNGKKWEKRWAVIRDGAEHNIAKISTDIMPTDGKNLKYRQLESIWTSFGLTEPILSRVELGGRIDEIVKLRNDIAHGNESPIEIGRRFTNEDLFKRFDDMNEYCTYVVSTFETYIQNRQYLKVV